MSKIISSSLIDNLILLLHKDNAVILKLLHILLISVLNNEKTVGKFCKTYVVENLISCVREKPRETCKIMLDFIIILIENREFRNLFMFLEGHLMLVK
jgi:hypothetical protein